MKSRKLIFFGILFCYAFMYIATTKRFCDDDCEKVNAVSQALRNKSYIEYVERCAFSRVSDSICIIVKDTIGVDWNHLADTTCILATQQGLLNQKIFVLKVGGTPYDTVARKICP